MHDYVEVAGDEADSCCVCFSKTSVKMFKCEHKTCETCVNAMIKQNSRDNVWNGSKLKPDFKTMQSTVCPLCRSKLDCLRFADRPDKIDLSYDLYPIVLPFMVVFGAIGVAGTLVGNTLMLPYNIYNVTKTNRLIVIAPFLLRGLAGYNCYDVHVRGFIRGHTKTRFLDLM
jgi:hypothetical protein